MAKDPSFPFYVQDYLVDTLRWDRQMKSLHVDLLAEYWANGEIINDNGFPKGLSAKDKKIWKKISHKWSEKDGFFFNAKLLEVRTERLKYLEIQSENGKKGGRPKRVALGKPKGSRTFSISSSLSTVNNTVYELSETTHPIIKLVAQTQNVSKLPSKLTEAQAKKLSDTYPMNIIENVLKAMENKKDLLTKYRSVYLTADNWCSSRLEKKAQSQNSGQGINETGLTVNP